MLQLTVEYKEIWHCQTMIHVMKQHKLNQILQMLSLQSKTES